MMRLRHVSFAGLLAAALFALSTPEMRGGVNDREAESADSAPVYELRTYTTAEGRLGALHKRFRDHTMKLFEKHGMKNVIYWTPLDRPKTLVYVVAHKNRAAAEKSWAAFRKDPAWQKAYQASIADGKIVLKVERQFLKATEYSPMK